MGVLTFGGREPAIIGFLVFSLTRNTPGAVVRRDCEIYRKRALLGKRARLHGKLPLKAT
jgi:hypothetical protein